MSQIIGHISQVIGPVVDVYFEGSDAELTGDKEAKRQNTGCRSSATHRRKYGSYRGYGQYRRTTARHEGVSHRRPDHDADRRTD